MSTILATIFSYITAVTCQIASTFFFGVAIFTLVKRGIQKEKPDSRFGYDFAQNCKTAFSFIRRTALRFIAWVSSVWTKYDCTEKCKNVLNKSKTFAVSSASKVKSFAARSVGKMKSTYASAKSSVKHFFGSAQTKRVAGIAAIALLLIGTVIIGYNANNDKAVKTAKSNAEWGYVTEVSEADISDGSEADVAETVTAKPVFAGAMANTFALSADVALIGEEELAEDADSSGSSTVSEPSDTTEVKEEKVTTKKTTSTRRETKKTTKKTTVKTTKKTTTTTKPSTTKKTTTTTVSTTAHKVTTTEPSSDAKTTVKTTAPTTATKKAAVGGWASESQMKADLRSYAESFGLAYCNELDDEMSPTAKIYSTQLGLPETFKRHCMDAVKSHAKRQGTQYELFQIEIVQIEKGEYRVDLYFG